MAIRGVLESDAFRNRIKHTKGGTTCVVHPAPAAQAAYLPSKVP